MTDLITLIARHGYLAIFLVVLAESLGMPFPAALALIAGGTAAASGTLHAYGVLVFAVLAMLLGDSVMFLLGRYTGWALLGFLCKVSINPETCILRSAETFYKRGKATLVVAKFLPGVNTMAPPLAGSMKMPYHQFLWLDLLGASLYAAGYCVLGFLFRDFVLAITRGIQTAGRLVEIVVLLALFAYLAYRIGVYYTHRIYRVVPRVQVEELARKLKSENGGNLVVVDVRSHGYYDSGAARIKGSIRIEPNNLEREIKTLPADKDIYVYCT
jgi:membrane protein DedA with SNARE-associated domain